MVKHLKIIYLYNCTCTVSPYTSNTSFLQISKNTIFAFIAVLDQSSSPLDNKFEENCEFNAITHVYHKIVDTMTVAGEGECASKCAVSCAGTELCQFY